MDPDIGDKSRPGDAQEEPTLALWLETGSSPQSQSSGSELLASQPQPFTWQLDVEDDSDVIIEEYDSDAT